MKFEPDEQVHLAELDLLDVVEVARCPEHDEQGLAVALELGPLVGDDRVLDGQLVQPELLGDGQQLALGRPEEADPGHRSRAIAQLAHGFGHGVRTPDPCAALVQRRVDQALIGSSAHARRSGLHRDLWRGLGRSCRRTSRRAPGWKLKTDASLGHHPPPVAPTRTASMPSMVATDRDS